MSRASNDRPPTLRAATRPAGSAAARRWPALGTRARRLLLAGLAAGVLIAAAMGWRLRERAPARIGTDEPAVAGASLSPEETALQQSAAASPSDPGPWRKLGELYLARSQPFAAIWSFREAQERGPEDTPTRLRLAEALEAAGLYRPALATLDEVIRRAPESLEARVRFARLSLQAGEAGTAQAVLRGAGDRAATWPTGLLELGRARQLAGDLPGAIQAYQRLLTISPADTEGSIRLARALLEHGRLDDARRVLEQGRAGAPRDPRFPFYLGLSWIQEGHPQKPDRAMEPLQEALSIAPRHALPHHYVGLLLARQNRWTEAQAHFRQAAQADPTYPEPQRQLALSLEKTGNVAEAKEQMGVYYFRRDDPYQAAEAFREMAKAAPHSAWAPQLVSLAYMRLGRNDWAIRETLAGLKQHPEDVALLERLATLYIMTHTRPPAKRACERWLKLEPGAARAHWLLGRIALDDLRLPEAIREFERAIARDPENPEYLAALAGALNDAGGAANLRRAASLLEGAVRRDPKTATYRHDLGMTLQQLGDLEGARRQFLAALDRNPRYGPAYTGLSQLCARLQKPGFARFLAPIVRAAHDRSREEQRLSRRLGENPLDPDAHLAMARFLIRQAAFPTAQSHLERALALRPDDPPARATLATVKRVISVR
jgi:tetratricopeptide (TPR) repeat protein